MSVWDEIAKDQKERKKRQGESGGGSENYSSWKEQYLAYDLGQRISSGEITAEDALNGLNSRINSWLGSAEDVAKGYNDRYFGEGVDNSAYRSDSGQYLNMLTGRKKSFDTEAENIKMYLNAYRKYMSDDYYNQILKSMESESKSFESIVNNAKKDNDHWSQFKNAGDYNFQRAIANGADEAALKELFDDMKSGYASLDDFYNDIEYARDYDTLFAYDPEEYKKAVGRINEINEMFDKEIGIEAIIKEAGSELQRSLRGSASDRDLLREELADLEAYRDKFLKIAEPEAYAAQLAEAEKLANMPAWEKALYTAGDFIQPAIYGGTRAVENLVEMVPRALAWGNDVVTTGLKEANRQITGYGADPFLDSHKEKVDAYIKEVVDHNWTAHQMGMVNPDGSFVENKGSYLYDLAPQVQGGLREVGEAVGNMAPASIATAINPALGQAVFFGSAAGGAAEEASIAGADNGTAVMYGLTSAGLELLTEKIGGSMFGGATELSGTLIGNKLLEKGKGHLVSQGMGKALYTFGSEGFEESIMDVFTPAVKAAFDIGDAREQYFGKNWKDGWGEVARGIPKTFVIGGTVGALYDGMYSGASALENYAIGSQAIGGIKGGASFNKIAKEMAAIAETIKANEAVSQSTTATQALKNQYSVAANGKILEGLEKISSMMSSLSAEQRIAVMENAPALEAYLNEDGNVRPEIVKSMAISSYTSANKTPAASVNAFQGKTGEGITARIEKRLSAHISDKAQIAEYAKTISRVVQGEGVRSSAVKKVLKNNYARNALNDYLKTQFKADSDVKAVRAAVAEKSGDYSPRGQAKQYAAIFNLGEHGTNGFIKMVASARGADIGNIAQGFNAAYSAGLRGEPISSVTGPYMLTQDQAALAYNYGVMDGAIEKSEEKSSDEVLQKDVERDTIKEKEQEGVENEREEAGSVHLRDGSERNDGENTGRQVSRVEGGAGQIESRRKNKDRHQPRDSEAASLTYGKEVSAQSLGIEGGLEVGKVHLVDEGSETAEMKKARERAESRGIELVFFVGGNLRVNIDGKIASVRGYVQGNKIFVRADHYAYTSDQLVRHEICHDMIDRGEISTEEIRAIVESNYDKAALDIIIAAYKEAYDGTGYSLDQIWEEIICDSFGEMNDLAEFSDHVGDMNVEFLQAIYKEIRTNVKSERGPPKSVQGKASRESRNKGADYLIHNFSGKINVDYAELYISDEELAIISSSIKTGWGALNKARTLGRVYTSEAYYLFSYHYDNSITIQNGYDLDVDRELVDILEEVFKGDKRGKRAIESISEWIGIVRSRQGRFNDNNGDSLWPSGKGGGFNDLDDGSSQSDAGRHIKSGSRDNKQKGKASQDLDSFDYLNENAEDAEITESETIEERELSNREILANMLESVAESARDKKLLAKYKGHLANIDESRAEISRLKDERLAADKAHKPAFTSKIKNLENSIANSEKHLINLESTPSLKYLVGKERKVRESEAHLAGQMAQGRRDAEIIRHVQEKLDAQKLEVRESMKAQKKKARNDLEEQAKRYQEARKKAIEGRHKTELKNKIKNVVAELDTLLRKGNKKSNVKIGLQDAVAAALEAFDVNAEKAERYAKDIARLDAKIAAATDPDEVEALTALRDKKVRNSEMLRDKLLAMKKAYEDIHKNAGEENYPAHYRAEAKVILDRISDVIEKVGDVPIGEMSLEQLQSVYDMYRMVLTTVRDVNKAFIDGKEVDLTVDASKVTVELNSIKKLPEERLKAGDDARGFVWNELTPYYAFRRIGSETLMRYYEELVRGQDVYARDLAEAKAIADEIRDKYNASKWKRNNVTVFKDKDGREFRLNLGHMMSIYAYSKRDQALDHMEKGGFFFNNKETFRTKGGILEFISSNESGYKVDATVFAQIKSALTADQIAYVDEMQAYLTKMGEKGNEVTRQMWGIDIFKEAVYFPLKSKEDFIYQANTPAETSSLKNDGMTKETRPGASNPIVLESFDEVWANHVNKMSTYHGFVIPIDNLNKIVNYGTWMDGDAQAISTMLEARYSSAVNDYLTTFIKDLNGAKAQSGGFIGGLSKGLTKFKKTSVGASLSVIVQQPTAIIRALGEIDARYFVHLPKTEGLKRKWAKVQQYAPVAILKDIGGFDAGSGKQITEWFNADTRQGARRVMNKIDDVTMAGAALGDKIGWASIWAAVEREVLAKQNFKYGTEEFYQACGKRFTEVIVRTQVYDSTLSRSGFMRGKDGLMKMATAFMGEPTLSINMLADAFLQAKRGKIKKRKMIRTVAAVYTATVAASLIKSFIYALRDDDDDESLAEKYLQALGGTILNDINPLAMIPVYRDVVSVFDGWGTDRSDMAIVQDLYDAINALDSDKKTDWRKFEDLAGAIGAIGGIPAKNILRTGREMYNLVNDIFDGIEGGDLKGAFMEGITGKDKSKSLALYEALVEGDPERIAALRNDYDTDKKYNTAVRSALRDHDPRIREAAMAYNAGDLDRWDELRHEILDEGIFDKEDIEEAIKSERNSYTSKVKEAAQAKVDGKDEDYDSIVDELFEKYETVVDEDELLDEIDEAADLIKDSEGATEEEYFWYSISDVNGWFNSGDTERAIEVLDELKQIKTESSLQSSVTTYWKPRYIEAYQSGNRSEMKRIKDILRDTGFYEDVEKTTKNWIKDK